MSFYFELFCFVSLVWKRSWHNVTLVSGVQHSDGTSLYLYAVLPTSVATICRHNYRKTTGYPPCAVRVVLVTYLFHNWKPVLSTSLHPFYPTPPPPAFWHGFRADCHWPYPPCLPPLSGSLFMSYLSQSNGFQSEFADHLLVLVILLQVESHVSAEFFCFWFIPLQKTVNVTYVSASVLPREILKTS